MNNPIHVTTRAVTIRARPAEVWPWLVQMGYGRGGMYSYDLVDRVMGILDPGEFLMVRKHLLGVKERAEK